LAPREEAQPDGRGGRDPGLADSGAGVFEMPIPAWIVKSDRLLAHYLFDDRNDDLAARAAGL